MGGHAEARGPARGGPCHRTAGGRGRRHLRRSRRRQRAAGGRQPPRRTCQRAVQPGQPAGGGGLARPDLRRHAQRAAGDRCARPLDRPADRRRGDAGPAAVARPAAHRAAGHGRQPGLAQPVAAAAPADDRHAADPAPCPDAFPAGAGRRLSCGSLRNLRPAHRALPDLGSARNGVAPGWRRTPHPPRRRGRHRLQLHRHRLAGRQLRHVLRARTRPDAACPCDACRDPSLFRGGRVDDARTRPRRAAPMRHRSSPSSPLSRSPSDSTSNGSSSSSSSCR